MGLTKFAISRRVTIAMFISILLVLGAVGLSDMPWELFPKIDVPIITVVVPYPGAGPEEVEQRVLKPLEDQCAIIEGVQVVHGYARQNVSVLSINFNYGTDLDVAAANVRDAVSRTQGEFPEGAEQASVMKLDIGAQPVFTMGVTGNRPPDEMLKLIEDRVKPRLGSIEGVANVTLTGGQQREIQVLADRARLESVGLTMSRLAGAIASANFNMPAGNIQEGMRDYRVRVLGEVQTMDELRRLVINTKNGGTFRLEDVAEVVDTVAEPTAYARIDGVASVAVGVLKQSDANTVTVCEGVEEAIEELDQILPDDIEFTVAANDAEAVIESVLDLRNAIIYGALFAALTVFLFLHNARGTLIVALVMPTALLATFLPIGIVGGFTLNMMVMLGLALSVGVLIDDSVVVLENIERHLKRGEVPTQAAINGRAEIGAAAVAITMVDVVVFLPIALMGGLGGQVFFGFAMTVVAAVLLSLLMAFTLTPMLASWWYRREHKGEAAPTGIAALFARFFAAWDRGFGRLEQAYGRALRSVIRRPYVTVAVAYGSLIIVMALLGRTLGNEFFPASDSSGVIVTVKAPVGTRLEETDRIVKLIEQRLSDRDKYPEIEHTFATSGTAGSAMMGSGDSGSRWGGLTLSLYSTLERRANRQRSSAQLALDMREELADIPGVDLTINATASNGPPGADVDFMVYSEDNDLLYKSAMAIRDAMEREIPGLYHCDVSSEAGQPEVQIRLNRERANDHDLSAVQVASALRASVEGDTGSKYRIAGDGYDIRVQVPEDEQSSVEDIRNLFVGLGRDDQPVMLRQVADVTVGSGPTEIEHYYRRRTVNITAYVTDAIASGDAEAAVTGLLDRTEMTGLDWDWGFAARMQHETMSNMMQAILLAVVFMYMVGAALYNSLLEPLNILMVLPLALVGAVIGLVVCGMDISIIALVGFIMLMGLVGKNAILVVDYTNTLRARGKQRTEALLEAGPTRLKPILMTTIAASMGMLPTALAMSEGSEWRAPMAIVVIFGLLLSTGVSLLVVPATYCIWDQVGDFFTRLGTRLFAHKEDMTDADAGEGE